MLYWLLLFTFALQCTATRSNDELRQVENSLNEFKKECSRKIQLRGLTDAGLRSKWGNAMTSIAIFRSQLKTMDEADLINIVSNGRKTLNDLMEIERSLVLTVGELLDEFRPELLKYAKECKHFLDTYAMYKGKLIGEPSSTIDKAEFKTLEQMRIRNQIATEKFTTRGRSLVRSLNNANRNADAYLYLKTSNEVLKLASQAKEGLKTCVDDIKRLYEFHSELKMALNDAVKQAQALDMTVAQLFALAKSKHSDYIASCTASLKTYRSYSEKLKEKKRCRKSKWCSKKTITTQEAFECPIQLVARDLSKLGREGKTFLTALSKVKGAADASPYLKRSFELFELGLRTAKTLDACVKEVKEQYHGFLPMETVEEIF